MAESTKEYKLGLSNEKRKGKCERVGWIVSGSPFSNDTNSSAQYSPSYDFSPYCAFSEDDFSVFEDFSFDLKTNKLYLSQNIGRTSAGEHKIKFVKQVKYKKKWWRKFLKCQGKR